MRVADRVRLRAPVILVILAATAIPVELRPLGSASLNFNIFFWDALANVAVYVPVGILLAELGSMRAIIAAASMTIFAECSQLAMLHRDPSLIDVATNALGATIGAFAGRRWRIRAPGLEFNRRRALAALMLASALILHVWAISRGSFNPRGATAPGTLEAHWKFDETRGRMVLDSSANGLYVRLLGSMTISAWINPTSHPYDDAVIVSQLDGSSGYQFDTTIDRGPRTIGYKLTNQDGEFVARYGATPLALNTRYHAAGVYDAAARTIDVYLNGELDNGDLVGSVTGLQRSSRAEVSAGRRSDLEGFDFAGSIDDVRIYSLALTKGEIEAVMRGAEVDFSAARRMAGTNAGTDAESAAGTVQWSDREEAGIPGAAALFGALVAFACAGLWPRAGSLLCLALSLAAGLLFLPALAPNLPSFNRWLLPIISLAGGASVAGSIEFASSNQRNSGSKKV